MCTHTNTLKQIMSFYKIDTLDYGVKGDKLGDVFEDYTVKVLNSSILLKKAKSKKLTLCDADEVVFNEVYQKILEYSPNITSLKASRDVEHRITGGNPKTDIIVDIVSADGNFCLPISVKQSTQDRVSMAEFDVKTIVEEIHIEDKYLIMLLEKHQRDGSAKNFTKQEKVELFNRLEPYRRELVHWVITGASTYSKDLRFPELILKYKLGEFSKIEQINCYTANEYVEMRLYDEKGNLTRAGFGTGLSWTYATGSKGDKIQFKG